MTTSFAPSAGITSAKVRHAPDRSGSVFVLPGDCFAPDAYTRLADWLFAQGVNAFVVDYLAMCESRLGGGRLSHADCVDAAVEAIAALRTAYGLSPDNPAFLLGHSRGAYIAIGALGRTPARGVWLHAPYWGPAHAARPPVSLIAEVGYRIVRKQPVRLSWTTFRRRFFDDNGDRRVAREEYERSRPIPTGLLFDRVQFDLGVLQRCDVAVSTYSEDRAVPTAHTIRTLESLKRTLNLQVTLTTLPGAHAEVVVRPHACAALTSGGVR